MIVKIRDKFQKDIKKIKDKKLQNKIQELISFVETIVSNMQEKQDIPDIFNMIKLFGHDNYYRIRIGNYRIGISIETQDDKKENEIDIFWFERFGHRKDFYRIFP